MPRIEPRLDERDRKHLRESGLTDKTIRDNGLYSDGQALVFPYCGLDGKAGDFCRTRPHAPRVINGKAVKYEQPKGEPCRAYFPKASLTKLRNGSGSIYLTEGEKKALALSQLGFPAIGLGGVWCWKVKDTDDLIPDLAGVEWNDREVYVVFDYDEKPKTRGHVDAARRRLAMALRKAGAKEIYSVELPGGPDGEKMGVDDFLVANGQPAFRELVDAAKPVPLGVRPVRVEAGRTDAANAQRLIDRCGNDVRWVGPWDKWVIWDAQRWAPDDRLRIERLAKETANELWREVGAEMADAQGHVSDAVMKAMFSYARSSNNAHGIRAMVALARSEPGVAIGTGELDADPWLFNVENGTLDLRTGKLQPHQRSDFITKLAPVTFDPAATCPLWHEFLRRIFDDQVAMIGYAQRLAGYSLTGLREEHLLPFMYGSGANGKTTFLELLLRLFGSDYAMKAAPDLLMARHGESHPTDRADLFGKRLVACTETEEGRRMAETLVKELTGGDRVRARRMREDFWEFVPTHHIWLAGNHKPRVIGTDLGIWRRIKLIPFTVSIPKAEQDRRLLEKLTAELPGILNWALEGCREWQRNGMQEPDAVQAATEEYADEMDEAGQFIDECCEVGEAFSAGATELFQAFQREMPHSRMSQHSFGAYLGRHGFTSGRTNKGKHGWKGLQLKSAAVVERVAAGIRKKGGG